MIDLNQQIHRYRLLYITGWMALLLSVAYAIATNAWLLLGASYLWSRVVAFFGVIIGLHRYFSHRSFETGPWRRRFLLLMGLLNGEGSPLSWAMLHRHHHRHADQSQDIHSPQESWLLSSLTWQVQPVSWWLQDKKITTLPRDLWRDPEVRFMDRYYYHIWSGLIAVVLSIDWIACLFFLLAPMGWSFLHAILINTICHTRCLGNYRNFPLSDTSQNNHVVAWLTFGEGYHNNHHADSANHRTSRLKGEFDPAGWMIERFFRSNP